MDFGGGDDIHFERIGCAGVVTLTRPKALNALNHPMVTALSKALAAWEGDAAVSVVVVRAEGRAFCAGGDLMAVHNSRFAPSSQMTAFFADEYRLNAAIARFRKPYVSLINGIVMGGGVGISCHGSHRVMTENALFAMPETGIGFFPDVGGSHLLPRLRGNFGYYLGLTGARIKSGDALWSGIATHVAPASVLEELFQEICASGEPDAVLRRLSVHTPPETSPEVLAKIERYFSTKSVDALAIELEANASQDEFANATLKAMRLKSPTSLKVAFRQLHEGAGKAMDECMRMEFQIVNQMLAGDDFYEGIRAVLIDKDNAPGWRPASIAEVSDNVVSAHFAGPAAGDLSL